MKLTSLDRLFIDYKHDLEIYINYIIDGILPIKTYYFSKLLPTETIKHSKYKREIIRSQLDKSKNKHK